jgi:TatA/E family protein of Tat protein translocase
MRNLGLGEWIVILVLVLLLFGARKLPDLARSLGRSLNEFKKGKEEGLKPESELKKTEAEAQKPEVKK